MQHGSDPTKRFSEHAGAYVRGRPGYPAGVIETLRGWGALPDGAVVADIGAGTGISTALYLQAGYTVCAVEPNRAMREAAELRFAGTPLFASIEGGAEATTLADDSVDLISASQAFHWFDPLPTRAEWQRILKPGGQVALIWNDRELDATPFLVDYEALLQRFGTDYNEVKHTRIDPDAIGAFFGAEPRSVALPYVHRCDRAMLRDRVLSVSYVPKAGQPGFDDMMALADTLFDRHQQHGVIEFLYQTRIYCAPLAP
ncbi:Methyltransferase domain-containing protein [Andreprevotia lacus DSM 23236]|jgi:SAM-dependent methyltransferase|uniref:Methyltransferase domain-containing protein n=1 Tax=Andreprevotia lacus DSM 23236 TaxID=1121001 RepID=A0A1W1XSV4_9NEIS|nr:class I SAM-dependent methyltransferase [Andreprevotia lacus]SMC27060.1 Methyltransferase domain-containing protein [Andreprevotia lacus DSM 23236]